MPQKLFKRRRKAERRNIRRETACGLLSAAVVLILSAANIGRSLDLSIFDRLMRWRKGAGRASEPVIIKIGQETIGSIDKWPLPRDTYTRLISFLSRAGARSVGFNIMFTERSSPEGDRELAEAVSRAGMVYLPLYLKKRAGVPGFQGVVENIPSLRNAASAEGHVNMPPDSDGVVRRVLLDIPFEGKEYLQLAFLMACDRLGASPRDLDARRAGEIRLERPRSGEISIPLDQHGAMIIDWSGPWRNSFEIYRLADILDSEEQIREGKPPRIQPRVFKDRICLVGLTAPGTFDAMRTPLEQIVPSIGIHAAIISQVLEGRFLKTLPKWKNLLIVALIGIAVSMIFPRLRPTVGAWAALGACTLYCLAAGLLFFRWRTQTTILYPVASIIVPYLVIAVQHEIFVSLERARLHHLATHDSLTELYSIGHFRLLLEVEVTESRRTGSPLSLIMLDVDRFKEINDTHGHQAGDAILTDVAKILKSSCRELDMVARYGGDEFIVLLPDTALGDAMRVGERIRASVSGHEFSLGEARYGATVSVGVAELGPSDTADSLVKEADAALYKAKRSGRDSVRAREPESPAPAR